MKAYLDLGAGVAGDMLLGALIGLGLSPRELEATLQKAIGIKGWKLRVKHVERRMWPAWAVSVQGDRPLTSPERMFDIIRRAPLPSQVRQRALAILKDLQRAEHEAHKSHGGKFDPKGLGRIDTLVDVIGGAWGFWKLGIEDVAASALNTGRIAPATVRLLARGKIPVFSDGPQHELATPTGVAILTHIARRFSPMPRVSIQSAGFGAGTLDRKGQPNVLAIYQLKPSQKLLK